jgi:hypothetical protein
MRITDKARWRFDQSILDGVAITGVRNVRIIPRTDLKFNKQVRVPTRLRARYFSAVCLDSYSVGRSQGKRLLGKSRRSHRHRCG